MLIIGIIQHPLTHVTAFMQQTN